MAVFPIYSKTPRPEMISKRLLADAALPCMGCTNRAVGCHGKCEKYITAKAEYSKAKRIARDAYNAEYSITNYVVDQKKKGNKKGV